MAAIWKISVWDAGTQNHKKGIKGMLYIYPHYYKRFTCIASECPDTCCAGWSIMIDERSLKQYGTVKGPFGNRLKNSIDWKEGSFKRYKGRCAFLNEEDLCDLYIEEGKDSLCRTCRMYPRHTEEFEGCREISLCLSCPAAAKLILGCKEPVRFLEKEDEKEETYEEFDFFLYTKLTDARTLILKILQNRQMEMELRLSMALALGHDLQRRIRENRLYEADALLVRYEKENREEYFRKKTVFGSRYRLMQDLFSILRKMEPLNAAWPRVREKLAAALYEGGEEAYKAGWKEFAAACPDLELWTEQMMVYFVFTGFCGGVYNENPYGKLKMAAASVLVIQDMALGRWMEQKCLTLDEMTDTAHRYSREVEHSDENRILLEKCLTKDERFGLTAFLGAIQEKC